MAKQKKKQGKALKTLQYSSSQNQIAGKNEKITKYITNPVKDDLLTVIKKSKKPVKVYEDPEEGKQESTSSLVVTTKSNINSQKDHSSKIPKNSNQVKKTNSDLESTDQEAYDLMVKEQIPESYWKEIAEQRRIALAESLEENSKLHTRIKELEEENEKLSQLASQAEYFASLLKCALEDSEESSTDAALSNLHQAAND